MGLSRGRDKLLVQACKALLVGTARGLSVGVLCVSASWFCFKKKFFSVLRVLLLLSIGSMMKLIWLTITIYSLSSIYME